MTQEPLQTGFDPNDRELCPDGACIGVIGADDRCSECGKGSVKKTPSAGRKTSPDDPDDNVQDKAPSSARGDAAPAAPAGPREVEADDFDPTRRELCSDGACIGIIGANGQCAECGKSAPGGSRAGGASTPDRDVDVDDEINPVDSEADLAPTKQDDSPNGASDEPSEPSEPSTEDERELCSDGACIGLIGSNGRCKVCGTRAD